MTFVPRQDGYYDDDDKWVRTKLCFVDCGDACTCRPPGGVFNRKAKLMDEDKNKNLVEKEAECDSVECGKS